MHVGNIKLLDEISDLLRTGRRVPGGHDHGPPADQRKENFWYPYVKTDGGAVQGPVIGSEAQQFAGMQQPVEDMTMFHHYTFWPTGGTRSIHDIGQARSRYIGQCVGPGAVPAPFNASPQVQHPDAESHLLRHGLIREAKGSRCIPQHEADPRRWQVRSNGQDGAAGPEYGQACDDEFRTTAHTDPHDSLPSNALFAEIGGQGCRKVVQHAVTQLTVRCYDRRPVGMTPGHINHQGMQRSAGVLLSDTGFHQPS